MIGRTGVELTTREVAAQVIFLTGIGPIVQLYLDECEGKTEVSFSGFAQWIQESLPEGGQS